MLTDVFCRMSYDILLRRVQERLVSKVETSWWKTGEKRGRQEETDGAMGGFGFAAFTEIQVYRTQEWWRIFEKSSLALFFSGRQRTARHGLFITLPHSESRNVRKLPLQSRSKRGQHELLLCVLSVFG